MREPPIGPTSASSSSPANPEHGLIDPQAEGLDLAPFFELMNNHFGAESLPCRKAGHRNHGAPLGGVVPHPVFDTQIAAMVCGFGDQVGYEAIVRRLAKVQIDKSSRFTDWSRRPLTEKQLAYALSDVTHLRVVYQKLQEELDKTGREPWLAEEMDILTYPATYRTEPEDAWKRIKVRLKSKKQLGVLVAVSAWREREAQEKNVPRARIIKDDAVAELAIQMPQTREALSQLRALPRGFANSRVGEAILKAVKEGLALDPKSLPHLEGGRDDISDQTQAAAEILKLALKVVCERENLAPKLVANTADIEAIAEDDNADVPLMHGWRRELFGNLALALKRGEAMIGFQNGNVRIIETNRPPAQPRRNNYSITTFPVRPISAASPAGAFRRVRPSGPRAFSAGGGPASCCRQG